MDKQTVALQGNQTWSFRFLTGKLLLGVDGFTQLSIEGSLDQLNAILVTQGFTHTYCTDFFDTSSLVVKMKSVRIIISIAAHYSFIN